MMKKAMEQNRGWTFVAAFLCVALGVVLQSSAETKTWNNNANSNWSADGTWDPTGVPTAANDVFFDNANTRTMTVNSTAVAASLDFTKEAWLEIQTGGSLAITGNITRTATNAGVIYIYNTDSSAASSVFTANSINLVQSLLVGGAVNADSYFTFGYDIATGAGFYLGGGATGAGQNGNNNYTVTQTGGTLFNQNGAFGLQIGSYATALGSGVATYNLNGGLIDVRRLGVNGPNTGTNRGTDVFASNGVLNFNDGTIRNQATNLTLEIDAGRAFQDYDGSGTKDMRRNTLRPLEIRLSENGTHTFDTRTTAGFVQGIVITPGARVLDQAGQAGTLRKIGTGDLTFTGGNDANTNTWTGDTTVEAGAIFSDYNRIAGQSATGGQDLLNNAYSAASKLVLDGGNYKMTGRGSAEAGSRTGVSMARDVFEFNVGDTTGLVIGQAVTNDNLPSGTYIRRIVSGGTTIELSAMSTYIGATALTGQTLTFGAASFDNRQTINAVELAQSATVTVDPGAGTSTTLLDFGDVSGTGGLTKAGAGVLRLTGNLSYTGATAVNAGGLIVNGAWTSGASDVTVASGALFGGNGTVEGAVSLAAGAFLAFDTASTLTLNGSLTVDSTFGVASLRNLSGGEIDWSSVSDGTYTLLDGTGLPTFDAATISDFGQANAVDIGGGRSAYFQDGSLQLVVIPEPATIGMLGFVMLVAMALRRLFVF